MNESINAKMAELLARGDIEGILKLALEVSKAEKAAKRELLEKHQADLKLLTEQFQDDIWSIFDKYGKMAGELVGIENVCVYAKMTSQEWSCGVTTKSKNVLGSGNGTTRSVSVGKFDMSTKDLLNLYGEDVDTKTDLTFTDAWERACNEEDRSNATYQVRVRLIRHHKKIVQAENEG